MFATTIAVAVARSDERRLDLETHSAAKTTATNQPPHAIILHAADTRGIQKTPEFPPTLADKIFLVVRDALKLTPCAVAAAMNVFRQPKTTELHL
jgi:hypothetical protein